MDIKKFVKSKKFKNIIITLAEVLIVAGLIYGGLMFVQSQINKDADAISGVGTSGKEKSGKSSIPNGSGKYYLQVNLKKNAVVVYEFTKKKKEKIPVKTFKASFGENVKAGKYKLTTKYQWIKNDGAWHKYNTQFSSRAWIQSCDYSDKYSYTLKKQSFYDLGKKKVSGSSIRLSAGDAAWIYDNCQEKAVVEIVKGKKKDKLPGEFNESPKLLKGCNWDPTDSDKNNPYFKKLQKGSIVTGTETVYVEKGKDPLYTANIIALNEKGKNITQKLKYKKFSTEETGTKEIKVWFKGAEGKKVSATQKFKIIDTTPPVVSCSKNYFTYEAKSRSTKDLKNADVKSHIENMVRGCVSVNETGCKITVTTVSKKELDFNKIPVIITAKDEAGNVGNYQVVVEIKEKMGKVKPHLSKKEEESLIAERKQLYKEKKKEQKDKKKKKK